MRNGYKLNIIGFVDMDVSGTTGDGELEIVNQGRQAKLCFAQETEAESVDAKEWLVTDQVCAGCTGILTHLSLFLFEADE